MVLLPEPTLGRVQLSLAVKTSPSLLGPHFPEKGGSKRRIAGQLVSELGVNLGHLACPCLVPSPAPKNLVRMYRTGDDVSGRGMGEKGGDSTIL